MSDATPRTQSEPGHSRRVPLSVLELVPRSQGMTAAEALRESTELARTVDRLGYKRLWVAEHHNTEGFLSSATSLALAHFAHHTERIRLGSGGVMLPNHSTLMVAEYYGTLRELYGDRFDLGLGRAPGTDPMTAAALARRTGQLDTFAQDVLALWEYLGEPRPGAKVRALPGEGTKIHCGSSAPPPVVPRWRRCSDCRTPSPVTSPRSRCARRCTCTASGSAPTRRRLR